MAGFEYKGQLSGGKENPVALKMKFANSSAIKVGDAVKLQTLSSGGGIMRATAGSKVVGIVQAIVDAQGIDLTNTSPDNFNGTWNSATNTYTSAADNVTNKAIAALVVIDENATYYNDTAGELAAADEFKFFDLTDQDQIADQNGHDTAGAFVLIKRDPYGLGDYSAGVFKIAESAFQPYAQQ